MAKTKKPTEIDIRKSGPQSYRDLQQLNALNRQATEQYMQKNYGYSNFRGPQLSSRTDDIWTGPVQSPIWQQSGGEDYVGNSYWDQHNYTVDDLELMQQNPNELRAQNQSGVMQLLNGTGKMLGLAGSTFLNSTIGLIAGLIQGTANKIGGGSFWEGMWNNAVIAGLEEFNKSMEEWMPNYYSQKELEGPWYENLFTANSIGDKILKNMGFTIGAMGAALLTGGLGSGGGITAGLTRLGLSATTAKTAGGIANRVINGLVSAAGEASIEAYNSVHDGMEKYNNDLDTYYNTQAQQLREKYQKDVDSGIAPQIAEQELNQGLKQLESNVNKAQQKYMKTVTDHGNAVFGMNMALLTISNNLEFGRIMKGGWGTQSALESAYKKGSKDVVRTIEGKVIGNTAADDVAWGKALAKGTAKYKSIVEEPSKAMWGKTAIKNALSEGGEEGGQRLISDTNQMRSQAIAQKESRRKGYIDYALDPEITDAMVNYSDALNHTWQESFGDASKSGWEEVALGALTGILGVPMIGKRKSGKVGLTWQGGFMEDYKEAKENRENIQKRVDALNETIDPEKLRKRIHNAVADIAVNQGQRTALFEDDHVSFKHQQVMGAVTTALNIRENQDGGEAFKAMIDEMSLGANDKDVAEYRQAMAAQYGIDDKILFAGKTTDDIKAEMTKNFNSFKKLLDKSINNYDKLSQDKRVKDKIRGLAFNELLHSYTLGQNIDERIQQIEERNQTLNQNDPLERKEYEDNVKDLAKLREDKKYFDQRVQNALENPEEFNDLVNTKVNNYIDAYNRLINNEAIKTVQNATTMEEVAQTLQPLSFEERERILEQAYSKADDKSKKVIDDYIKFQDDAYAVKHVINRALQNHNKQINDQVEADTQQVAEQLESLNGENNEYDELVNYLAEEYIKRKRTARGEDLSVAQTQEERENDIQGFMADVDFLNEQFQILQQQMYEAMSGRSVNNQHNVPSLLETLSKVLPIIEQYTERTDNAIDSYNNSEIAMTELFDALYKDIVFRDNIGQTTTIADAIRNTIDTLERDQSLSPELKQVLLDALDSLKDNETVQSVRNVIKQKKEIFAKKRELDKKNREKNNKTDKTDKKEDNTDSSTNTQSTEDEEVPEGNMPEDVEIFENVSDLIDYINQKRREGEPKLIPSKNLLNLNIKIAISPNDGVYNENRAESNAFYAAISYLNDIHPKAVEKIANGTANKEMVDRVTEYVKTALKLMDQGYVVRNIFADKVITTINELLNDEIAQWYSNYKGADDNTEGTDAEPDNNTDATEENHEEQSSSAGDYAGNQIHEVEMLNKPENRHKLHILDYRALKEMQRDGVRTQWLIDNVLGKVFAAKPDITVRFLTTGKDIIYLGIKQEDVKNLIPNSNNISVVDTNDGRYVIIGTCGYMKGTDNKPVNQSSWNKLKDKLQKGFDKKEDNNKFYVDTELHTNITNVTPGEFITTTDDENHEVFRTVANLLQNANPHNLKPSDLTFLVVMGNEEDFVYTDFVNQKDGKSYRETDAQNTGGVYMYIPTGRADEMIPIMLRSVSWNDMFEGGLASIFTNSDYYKTTIGSRIDTLMNSTDNVEKIKAIGQLRDLLLFNKHKLDTGVSEAIRYNEKDGTTQYLNDKGQWITINNKEEFLDALQKLNPRISLDKVQLTNPKLYIDAGILQTNVKSLSTMKSTFYVRGLDDDLNLLEAQERNPDDYNLHPNNVKSVLYLDKKVYYHKADGIYDKEGNKLSDEEAQNVRELQSVILTGQRYKMEDRRYVISKDKKTVYLHENKSYIKLNEGMSRIIIKSYEKWLEEQQKKQNRDNLDSNEQLGNNQQTNEKGSKNYDSIIEDLKSKQGVLIEPKFTIRPDGYISIGADSFELSQKAAKYLVETIFGMSIEQLLDSNGSITGKVTYTTSTGRQRTITYTAKKDNDGFLRIEKTLGTSQLKINESFFSDAGFTAEDILGLKPEDFNDYGSQDAFDVGDTLTLVNYDENGKEIDRYVVSVQEVFDNGGIKVNNGVEYSPRMVDAFFGRVKPFTQGAHTRIIRNSRLGEAIPYTDINESQEQKNKGLDNSGNNDNFAKVLDFVKSYRNAIMDDDTVFENTYKLLGITEEEADELNPDELAEKLTQKLVDKGVKAADITRWEDLIQAIDNALNC